MSAHRLPGSTGINHDGDNVPTERHRKFTRGVVDAQAKHALLSSGDLNFIADTAGRNIDKSIVPLAALRHQYQSHLQQLREAVKSHGAECWNAAFERAVLQRLSGLIAQAESPLPSSARQLTTLLKRARRGQPVKDADFSHAVTQVLEEQKTRALHSKDGETDQRVKALVNETLVWVAERDKAQLAILLKQAKRHGAKISDQQLLSAVRKALNAEHQLQKSDLSNDNAAAAFNALLGDVLILIVKRRKAKLTELLHEAKRGGNRVSDKQLHDAVTNLLSVEKQTQLLGVESSDPAEPQIGQLLNEVIQVSEARHGQRLRQLIDQAKHAPLKVSRAHMGAAVMALLGDEHQRQLMGGEENATSQHLWELLNAAEQVLERRSPARRPPKGHLSIGEAEIGKRK